MSIKYIHFIFYSLSFKPVAHFSSKDISPTSTRFLSTISLSNLLGNCRPEAKTQRKRGNMRLAGKERD